LDPDRARNGFELAASAVERGARLVLAAARAEPPADDDARLAGVHGYLEAGRQLAEQHQAHVRRRRGEAGTVERRPDELVGDRRAVRRKRAVRRPRAGDDTVLTHAAAEDPQRVGAARRAADEALGRGMRRKAGVT